MSSPPEPHAAAPLWEPHFVFTRPYRQFAEFCDACRRYCYIGLCYGPPGVGKTLSARHYAGWDRVEAVAPLRDAPLEQIESLLGQQTVLYTPPVVNSPGLVGSQIQSLRQSLCSLHREPIRRQEEALLARVREYEAQRDRERQERLWRHDWFSGPMPEPPRTEPTFAEVGRTFQQKQDRVADPTRLILIDEADRLKMSGLEQVRAIFDAGRIGLVLLGMPGLEKRLIRYPQLFSRVGFVHEFRPLRAEEVRHLLELNWQPPEVSQPMRGLCSEEVIAALVRITGGNFRLLHRLLTQIARVMEVNALERVTPEAVETARESLVIGSL